MREKETERYTGSIALGQLSFNTREMLVVGGGGAGGGGARRGAGGGAGGFCSRLLCSCGRLFLLPFDVFKTVIN